MTAAKQKNEKLLYFQTLIIHYIEYTIGYLHNQLYCFLFAFKENRLNIWVEFQALYTKHTQLTCQIFSDVDNVVKIFFSPRNFWGWLKASLGKLL